MAMRAPSRPGMRGGRPGMGGRNGIIKVARNEFLILSLLLPYLAMVLGMVLMLVLAVATRVYIGIDHKWVDGDAVRSSWYMTGIVFVSFVTLAPLAYVFWGQRKAPLIKEHAVITIGVAHYWWLLAIWDNVGGWIWSEFTWMLWLFGNIIVGLTWCLRRWSKGDGTEDTDDRGENPFDQIGLKDSHGTRPVIDGDLVTTTLKLGNGVTVDDAKKKRAQLAGLAGVSRQRLHVRETKNGREDQAEVVILRRDPFAKPIPWQGPYLPGESIKAFIEYGTYEDLSRTGIYIAGKDDNSSEHFLCMGMSGVGKSKCWQCIYGTVLNRREVNVIYGDPIKGLQTAGPIVEGLSWFADTREKCMAMIAAVENAIRVRTDFLTSRGLSHWEEGCGINFLIFHLEEAARFAKVGALIELVEAARSAGIMIVLSLQRASGTRLKTDTRYNLGASMCFGTYGLRDAEFALSEYTRQGGAIPHFWQNRFPGRHYLETSGVDPRKFPMSSQVDWTEMVALREAVRGGVVHRTAMDETTARALGAGYAEYVKDVERGNAVWQMQDNGLVVPRDDAPTIEFPRTDPAETRTQTIDKARAEELLWEWLELRARDGVTEFQFKEVKEALCATIERSPAWINSCLQAWTRAGRLPAHARYGWYATPASTREGDDT